MPDLVVFAALGWESAAVRAALAATRPGPGPRRWCGRLGDGRTCLLVQTGVGLARAAAAAAAAPAARGFVSIGCAGALEPGLRCGDAVVASAVVRLDASGAVLETLPARAGGLMRRAAACGERVRCGAVASSTAVLGGGAAKAVAARSGALVVEMEAAAIAAAARARGVPFAAVRVVLDEADDAVPMLDGVLDEDTGEVRPLRAARVVLPRPWLWRAVARTARQQRVTDARLRALSARLLDAVALAEGSAAEG